MLTPHFADDVPGGLRIVDTDNSGTLDANDRVPLGNPYPDFTWGLTNNLRYKNFDFSILIQGVQGITVFNGDVYYNETLRYNKAYAKNRWISAEHPGDGKTPYEKNGHNLLLTDYPLQNASYAACATLPWLHHAKGHCQENASQRLEILSLGQQPAVYMEWRLSWYQPRVKIHDRILHQHPDRWYQRGGSSHINHICRI